MIDYTDVNNKRYHIHGCNECKKAVVKPGPWAVCRMAEKYEHCQNHVESCWHRHGEQSPRVPDTPRLPSFVPNVPCTASTNTLSGVPDLPDLERRGGNGMSTTVAHGICLFGKCNTTGSRCLPEGYCPTHCIQHHAKGSKVCNWTGLPRSYDAPTNVEPKDAELLEEESF